MLLSSHITSLQSNQDISDFRLFNETTHQIFENLINGEAWSEISDDMDPQLAYNKLDEIRTTALGTINRKIHRNFYVYHVKTNGMIRNHGFYHD